MDKNKMIRRNKKKTTKKSHLPQMTRFPKIHPTRVKNMKKGVQKDLRRR